MNLSPPEVPMCFISLGFLSKPSRKLTSCQGTYLGATLLKYPAISLNNSKNLVSSSVNKASTFPTTTLLGELVMK